MLMYRQGSFLDQDLEQYKNKHEKLLLEQDSRTKKYNK